MSSNSDSYDGGKPKKEKSIEANSQTTSTKVKISDIKITDISPKIPMDSHANGMLKHLVMKPMSCEFIIDGAITAIANGIRRSICSGVIAQRLNFVYTDFETNDPFMKLPDFIIDRINAIPILQGIDDKLVLKLDFKNTTANNVDVCTDQLMVVSGKVDLKKMFDQNIPIANLGPDKYMRIKKIVVTRGYEKQHGTYALSCAVSCVPFGVAIYNMYTGVGESATTARVTKHKISFETNGNIEPINLVKLACEEMIAQLEKIRGLIPTIVAIDNYYKLVVAGADDTCGNAIVASACELYPDIPAINYRVDAVNEVLTISIRCENPGDILTMTIQYCVDIINDIISQLH